MTRTSQGRQRIQMEKIGNESSLLVAFAKRRSGIFKKASELCTLCGVEIAVLIFSPTNKVFSFGHPCVEKLVDRFLERTPSPSTGTSQLVEHYRNSNILELNSKLTDLLDQVEAEKKTGEEFDQQGKERQNNFWWDAPLETLEVEDLENLKLALLDLKINAENQAERLTAETANTMPMVPVSFSTGAGGVGPST